MFNRNIQAVDVIENSHVKDVKWIILLTPNIYQVLSLQFVVTKVIDEACSFSAQSVKRSVGRVYRRAEALLTLHVVSGTEWKRGLAVTATPAPQCSVLPSSSRPPGAAQSHPVQPCTCSTNSAWRLLSGNWVYPLEFFWIKPFVFGVPLLAAACFRQLCSRHAEPGTNGAEEVSHPLPQPMFPCVPRISFSQKPTPQTQTNPLSEAPHPNLNHGKISTGYEWESTAP